MKKIYKQPNLRIEEYSDVIVMSVTSDGSETLINDDDIFVLD